MLLAEEYHRERSGEYDFVRNDVRICVRKFWIFSGSLRAAALKNPAKGLPPLNPAHFFEKKWTKNFSLS